MRKLLVRSVVAVTAALAVLAGGVSASSAGTDAQAPKLSYHLTIGDLLQLTGSGAPFGPPYELAAQLALDQINKAIKADKLNISVSLVNVDDQTTPQGAVDAGQHAIADGATCLAGPNTSDAALALAQSVVFPQQIPDIVDGASSDQITTLNRHGLLFRLYPADKMQALLLSHVIARRLHGSKGKLIAVAGANTPFGAGFATEFAADWKALGGRVAGPVLYDPTALSYDSEAQQLAAGNPKAYVVIDNIGDSSFATLAGALLRTGNFSGAKLFVGGGQSAQVPPNTPFQAVEGAEGLRPAAPTGSKAYQAFLNLYNSTPNAPQMQVFTQNNFDAVMMCFLASVAAHSASGPAIAKELRAVSGPPGPMYTWLQLPQAVAALAKGEDINYQGISGNIDWNAIGDVQAGIWSVYQYKKDVQTVVTNITTNFLKAGAGKK